MIVKLLTEQHLEFLSLQGGCRDSTESTLVKIPNCWKSHALAHLEFLSLKGGCTSSSSESTLEKNNTTLFEITCRGIMLLKLKRDGFLPPLPI